MKRNMLEKDPWSHTPHDVFAASCDGDTVKDMSNLVFDDSRISSYGFKNSNGTSDSEFCKDDCILNGTSSAADSNSYTYQLSHIPQTEDLTFFDSSCEDKESSDLLYNGWPDMGNFEEVDRILRSRDSSFGLGVTGNNDEMNWFTLEDPLVGCEEVLTMDFKVPCSEPSDLINISQDSEPSGSDGKRPSYAFENKDEFKLKVQGVESKDAIQLRNGKGARFKKDDRMKQQSKHHQSEEKEARQCLGRDGNRQQKRNLEFDTYGYMQNNTYLPMESSHVTNQAHSMERSGNPSLQGTVKVDDRRKVHQSHQSDPQGFQKEASAEIGSSNVPVRSSVSSGLDDISLEATSFCQLRQVMEQLDMRTKLCIKDSLYRLARSAEQRHNHAGLSGSVADHGDTRGPLMTQRTNKCTGFMDMETDTNPIDRSIAHLLFHRPSDTSNLPTSLPLKPSPVMHGFILSQPVAALKLDCHEERANESADMVIDD